MASREDFFAEMDAALRARGGDSTAGFFPAGQVKIRLVEAHPSELSEDGVKRMLSTIADGVGMTCEPFAEDVYVLRSNDLTLAVDTLEPRFWQVYNTSSKGAGDRVLRRLLSTNTQLDSAWVPRVLLQELDGTHRWLKSSFEGDDLLGPEAPARRWKARFEGDTPDDLLELLAKESQYARASALAAIGTSVAESGLGKAQVVADWRGNFIIGQGALSAGASVVTRAADRYAAFVRALEARHRLRFAADEKGTSGISVDGDVAVLWLDEPVEDLGTLVDGLFAAKEPFRLWAVPRQVGEYEWEANAVDLHVGQPLRLEITPNQVRVLLGEHTCGNTLARLLTNLQQHLDARIQLLAA